MKNIYFKIGQPNTGKSHGFKKENLQELEEFKDRIIIHKIIPVSGGIGNEYKGLQNTDLALSNDSINKTIRFGEFLQMLMSAIIQPDVMHIVFLDDFHNQDISSLLSEYTPLFKNQQKVDLSKHKSFITSKAINLDLLKEEDFETAEKFIAQWNQFIEELSVQTGSELKLTIVPITNRISGSDLNLIFPANFYLFGAANFNEKTLNIFADWADRAVIEIINPLDVQDKVFDKTDTDGFIECCKLLNTNLKAILHKEKIFDYEKYCFGIWKVVDENDNVITGDNRIETIKFFFSMIKNSLVYNNKNSHINKIGLELILSMKTDNWFTANILSKSKIERLEKLDIDVDEENGEIYEVLHSLGIYDN